MSVRAILQHTRKSRLLQTILLLVVTAGSWPPGAIAGGVARIAAGSASEYSHRSNETETGPRNRGSQWQSALTKLTGAEERMNQAEEDVERSRILVRRARQRRYPRGEALTQLREALSRNEATREAAEQSFLEQVQLARRQGVPIGLLADFLDRADQIESMHSARAGELQATSPSE